MASQCRIKAIDIELSSPPSRIQDLKGYRQLRVLAHLHGKPIAFVDYLVNGASCSSKPILEKIIQKHTKPIFCQLLLNYLNSPERQSLEFSELLQCTPKPHTPDINPRMPSTTVAFCLVHSFSYVLPCLDSIYQTSYPGDIEVLIIHQNSDSTSQALIKDRYPDVRYVFEPQSGFNAMRNRAILEARHDVIAFIQDDVLVDPSWLGVIGRAFAEHPQAMAVTGLVAAHQETTDAQILLDHERDYFGNGFEQQYHCFAPGRDIGREWLIPYRLGSSLNMAYRRSFFEKFGDFNPNFDLEETGEAGVFEMLFRVLKSGHAIIYEPQAISRHCKPIETSQLSARAISNSLSQSVYLLACADLYSEQKWGFLRIWFWLVRCALFPGLRPQGLPQTLASAQRKGFLSGWRHYRQAVKQFHRFREHLASDGLAATQHQSAQTVSSLESFPSQRTPNSPSFHLVELSQPFKRLTALESNQAVHVLVGWQGSWIGRATIETHGQREISPDSLRHEIVAQLWREFLDFSLGCNKKDYYVWDLAQYQLRQHYLTIEAQQSDSTGLPKTLPASTSVSIVIATYDRPHDLRECLQHLIAQNSSRPVEIIVVDNHPVSNLTPPVLAEFPEVKLLQETRQGSAYARNAGILASQGDIIVTVDDDVITPPDWLENLLVPFTQEEVMAVTGNIFPLALETQAQQMFEKYCSLSCGFQELEVDGNFFWSSREPVQGWDFGATANSAFRASVLADPEVGLMEETLGPGTPSGAGEDPYLFYKILRAGYKLVYKPSVYVWHKHRQNMNALYRQTYNYGKSAVAYHLTTLIRDGDKRALRSLLGGLQQYYLRRLIASLRGQIDYPVELVMREIAGHLAGPWGLWCSYRRVRKFGRSR